MRARRIVPAHALAQFPYRFRQIVDMNAFRRLSGVRAVQHAAQQIVVVLVAIGFEIEIFRYFGEPLVTDVFDVFLHERVVFAPRDPGRAYRRLLGARGDLMGMKVMQAELIDQRLLDLLMQDEKAIGVDLAAAEFEELRHVTIDIDRLAVEAVAGEVGNIVAAVEILDAPADRVERAIHHQARDVPLRQPELFVRGGGMAIIERHGGGPQVPVRIWMMKTIHMIASAKAEMPKNMPRSRTLLFVTCT